jgi:hypothetical protein
MIGWPEVPGMGRYTIERVDEPVPLTGDVAGTPWSRAEEATMDRYPWTSPPERSASARVLYDDEALYCQFVVHEDRVTGVETERNGDVWLDSAVELFFDPTPATPEYCNFEANCLGTILLYRRTAETVQRPIDAAAAAAIDVETSVDEPGTGRAVPDGEWWLAVAIPFETIGELLDEPVAPEPSDLWRGNLHALRRGESGAIGVWNPIEDSERDLHQPAYFGEFEFGTGSDGT